MLGDKIAQSTGKVTGRRVLPNPGGGPKMETSFEAAGRTGGVDVREVGTFWAVVRPDGSIYGEGQGVLEGKGESATWIGQGVGRMRDDGGASYRGAVYHQSSTPALSKLNGMAAVFEFEIDAQGHTRGDLWEWK